MVEHKTHPSEGYTVEVVPVGSNPDPYNLWVDCL